MTKKIVLVGCGNVGSRHLQALAKLPFKAEIDIVEPNKESKSLGKSRLKDVLPNKNESKFTWRESINDLNPGADIAIIATTSVGRGDILNQLMESGIKKFLVEKMVCQSSEHYEQILFQLKKNNARGWVNTNLRYFNAWQKIKKYFSDSDTIHLSIIASNFSALGTNAIHYLDLFSFFIEDYQIELNGQFLLNKLFPNKRGGNFKEFGGMITGSNKKGSTLSMTFMPESKIPNILNIAGKDKHLMVDEVNELVFDLAHNQSSKIDFRFEHLSSLTTKIIIDILNTDGCKLTSLENSYYLHDKLFRIFNSHIKKITDEDVKLCPIT